MQLAAIWGLRLWAGRTYSGVEGSCLLLYVSVLASLELLLWLTVGWRLEPLLQSPLLSVNEEDKLPHFSYSLRMPEAAQDPGGRWHLLH